VFVVLGLLAGGIYELVFPPGYSATALVLLPQSSSASAAASSGSSSLAPAANTVETDAQIATSGAVLRPAGNQVNSRLTLADLQSRISAHTSNGGVLGITATGSSAREAEALANAVANQLVTFVTANGSATSSGTLTGLQNQSDQLTSELQNVQTEINAANQRLLTESTSSTAGQQDAQLIGNLTTEQSNLVAQQSTVKNEINQLKLGIASANQGTEVIQRATAQGASASSIALVILLGGICGLLVGSIYVLAVHRRDPRLWSRDQLADAVGSPVLLSSRSMGKRSSSEWIEILKRYTPSSAEQWNVRKALRELGVGDGATSLLILTLGGDDAAVALTAQLAMSAALSGVTTAYSIADHGDSAAALEVACGRFASIGSSPRPDLEVATGVPQRRSDAELSVVAVVLDANDPTPETDGDGSTDVLVAVSAGFATAEQLARLAIRASNGGIQLKGVIVANPAVEDQSTGRSPEANTRTALVVQRRALGADARLVLGRPS
jgi:capsular polysaccharide biosynthesis protein